MTILFENCDVSLSETLYFGGGYRYGNDIALFKVNGLPLKWLYGNWTSHPNCAYVVLENYTPDTDLQITIDVPAVIGNSFNPRSFGCSNIRGLTLDTVREMPYGSGNYVAVNTIPIFQPDDGKGKGPATELTNIPFLKLKFNEIPSDSQIDTLQATLTIADSTQAFNLTETAVDSNIFVNSVNGVTVTFNSLPAFSSNLQDEVTCRVNSSFGSLSNKLFNLKESASDSLYFNDVTPFVTVTFNNELTSYQADTLTIQYDNGAKVSKEILTETAPDSLVFTNVNNTFTVTLNNYQGALPNNLDITINNINYLEVSKAELLIPIVPRVGSNSPYVYTDEPVLGGSDLPPNNPLDEGQGIFKVRVTGLPTGLSSDVLSSLPVTVTSDLGSKTLNLSAQTDGYYTLPMVLLPPNDTTTYDGIICSNSSSGEDNLDVQLIDLSSNTTAEVNDDVVKGAFLGGYVPEPSFKDALGSNLKIIKKRLENLGYTTSIPDEYLTKQHFKDALPKYSVWYTLTHGTVDTLENKIFVAIHAARDEGFPPEYDGEIYPTDVQGSIGGNSYKLVFLNGCYTADKKCGSATAIAFKTYFNATEYVGWNVSPWAWSAASYGQNFFEKLSQNDTTANSVTVEEAYDSLVDYKIHADGWRFWFIEFHGSDARYLGDGTTNIHLEK